MELSVVTTLYRSKPFLGRFFEQIVAEIEKNGITEYEIVVVNDGSPDDSLEYCLEAKQQYPQIKIIDLSRNFGHHYAIQAGLEFAAGDLIYIADNDLETPASFFSSCYQEIINDRSYEMIYGVQEERKGHFVEKVGGHIFWKLFNRMSETKVPSNVLTECLFSQRVRDQILRMNDANLFMAGMQHWVGFNKKGLPCPKGLREGKSTYTVSKRVSLFIQALTSFSGKPLELLFYLGLCIVFFSTVFLIFIIIQKFIKGNNISIGWTSLIALNLLSLGIIVTFMGLLGLYIYRIYRQVQGRPNYIIKKIYE